MSACILPLPQLLLSVLVVLSVLPLPQLLSLCTPAATAVLSVLAVPSVLVQVPVFLEDPLINMLSPGRVVCSQPKRNNASKAAKTIADDLTCLLNKEITCGGDDMRVGWRVGGGRKECQPGTRIQVRHSIGEELS